MPTGRRLHTLCRLGIYSFMIMILAAPGVAQMLPGPVPEKDDPVEWTTISVGARVHCPGITWGSQTEDSGTVFSNFFGWTFAGKCRRRRQTGASSSFPAGYGGIAWSSGFSTNGKPRPGCPPRTLVGVRAFPSTAYPIDRVLVYDPDG